MGVTPARWLLESIEDWGQIKLDGNKGTYTGTFSGGIGNFEFTKTAEHQYDAKSGESKLRHGTMKLTVSVDGHKITRGPFTWVKR